MTHNASSRKARNPPTPSAVLPQCRRGLFKFRQSGPSVNPAVKEMPYPNLVPPAAHQTAIVRPPKHEQKLPVLFTAEQIARRTAEIGRQIDADFAGQSVVLVGVLKGAAIFLADLSRSITIDCTFDFVAVSSYGKGQQSTGAVKLIKDLDQPIEGTNIILVEDILDTGLTLCFLRKLLLQHKPKTLKIATLLDKPSRRLEKIDADYIGFTIPNHFVIGYGMDYAERYRNLPDICLMPPDFPE
jgi:hypoxanthine phosphoribosyltransferase